MFGSYRRTMAEVEELNMIPVMNLFIVLIPFLLAAAAFYHIGVVPGSTPQHTPGDSDVPATPVTVTLNIVVKPELLRVTASSISMSPEELAALAFETPKGPKGFDLEAMQEHIAGLKKGYPKSNTAIVLPYDDMLYEDLIAIVDMVRERRLDSEHAESLFPVIVFSQFVPPSVDDEAEGGEGGEGGGGEGGEEAEPEAGEE